MPNDHTLGSLWLNAGSAIRLFFAPSHNLLAQPGPIRSHRKHCHDDTCYGCSYIQALISVPYLRKSMGLWAGLTVRFV